MVPRMSIGDLVGQMFVVSMAGTQPDYYIRRWVESGTSACDPLRLQHGK